MPALLTLDPWKKTLSVQEFGTVWDGQPAEQVRVLAEDDRIAFLLDEPGGSRFVGAIAHKPFEIELVGRLEVDELVDEPRFIVPALGPEALSLGENPAACPAALQRGRTHERRAALPCRDRRPGVRAQLALSMFKLAIEAGDLKGHFGAGYTLLELGYAAPAAEHLRIYTRLTPVNAWAWCWLGKAQLVLGETTAARASFERAIESRRPAGSRPMPPSCSRASASGWVRRRLRARSQVASRVVVIGSDLTVRSPEVRATTA